jgi:hypothetical protein
MKDADFSGWATKAGLECSDGRTIMGGAFKHQDKVKVPLVWQHAHNSPENILGHAYLENRGEEGVYAYCFFNKTPQAQIARELIEHKDISMMSIWANSLVERAKKVFHGAIREVSLVLHGANPGALIENVTIRHSDGSEDLLDEDVIIYTGIPFEHAEGAGKAADEESKEDEGDEESLEDVFHTMTEKQQKVVLYMVAQAAAGVVQHSLEDADDPTFKQIYDDMSDEQKTMVHYLVAEVSEKNGSAAHSDIDAGTDGADGTAETGTQGADGTADDGTDGTDDTGTTDGAEDTGNDGAGEAGSDADTNDNDDSKGSEMKHHNVFEQKEGAPVASVLSHAEQANILQDALKSEAKLSDVIEAYAAEHLEHGIQDIDTLFPEARALADSPELFSRRTEWVANVLSKVRKSPFARIKTVSADLTVAEARAKGYITGSLKKEEFFRVAKRSTNPTTIYKKQKLDRDDMIDITDFDVVSWLKGEMRLMLDEELARAILLGDGRDPADEDKIDEDAIRPVASDHELYVTTVNVNVGDANSSHREILDALVRNRRHLRGTGLPTMYTTESVIAELMLLRDTLGRRIYSTLAEVAAEIRVDSIVPVEVMEEYPDILAIVVNLGDYVVGADKGGNVSMFDDFDIDYNQYKYLIETRASGALVKLKSAMVVRSVAAGDQLVTPAAPTFDEETGEVTITDTANVTYRNADTDAVMTALGSPYAVPEGDTINIVAEPAAGYYVSDSEADDWQFTNNA